MRPDRAERIRNPPPEIRQKLDALHNYHTLIKQLNERLRNAQRTLHKLESELALYHASVAPIQDCPPEILGMIFEFVLGSNPQRIRSLMLVCQEWYGVLVANPLFWTEIPISFNGDGSIHRLLPSANQYLNACCRNSGQSPLHLTLDFSHLSFSFKHGVVTKSAKGSTRQAREPIDSMHFIPSLLEGCEDVIRKSQSISLTFPDSEMLSRDIWCSLLYSTPNLTDLSIYRAGHAYNTARATFVGGFKDLLSLSTLILDEIPDMDFLPLSFSSIEDLEICTDLGRSGNLDLNRFVELKSLTITYTSHRWNAESTSPTSAVFLPNLRELFLIGNFTSINNVIFTTPKLEYVYIQQTSGDRTSQPELPDLNVPSVGWSNLDCETGEWSHGSRSQLKKILSRFQNSEVLTIPARSKNTLVAIIEKLRKHGSVPGSWKKVILEDEDGEVETLIISDI